MKILVLSAHPDLSKSSINRAWFDALSDQDDITLRDLSAIGGETLRFDIEAEQALLLAHDRIVFQFPFYWYSAPPVLKAWMDQVLSYGPGGEALKGKEFTMLISTGGPEDSYHAGAYNNFSMDELLKPFQQTANLTGMTYLRPMVAHGMAQAGDDDIAQQSGAALVYLRDPELNPAVKLQRLLAEIEADAAKAAAVS